MRDKGRMEAGSQSPVWEPARGQAVSTDRRQEGAHSRVQAVSGQGKKAVQKSHKVKRKGLLAGETVEGRNSSSYVAGHL